MFAPFEAELANLSTLLIISQSINQSFAHKSIQNTQMQQHK